MIGSVPDWLVSHDRELSGMYVVVLWRSNRGPKMGQIVLRTLAHTPAATRWYTLALTHLGWRPVPSRE